MTQITVPKETLLTITHKMQEAEVAIAELAAALSHLTVWPHKVQAHDKCTAPRKLSRSCGRPWNT
jgi:hypothetical protein